HLADVGIDVDDVAGPYDIRRSFSHRAVALTTTPCGQGLVADADAKRRMGQLTRSIPFRRLEDNLVRFATAHHLQRTPRRRPAKAVTELLSQPAACRYEDLTGLRLRGEGGRRRH